MSRPSSSSSTLEQDGSIHLRYSFAEKLREGSYGQVRVCVDRYTKMVHAVKIVDLRHKAVTRKVVVQQERFAWTRVGKHENVASLLHSFTDKYFSYFVMEQCRHTLPDVLARKGGHIPESHLMYTFRHMLLGLQHCHSKKIIHRDVKPSSFLVGFDGTVKLADFVLAIVMPLESLTESVGTLPYMSPQAAQGLKYGLETDIWSLGVTAYVLLYGMYPYGPSKQQDGESDQENDGSAMKSAIANDKYEPQYLVENSSLQPSDCARGFVQALLQRHRDQRPDAGSCLELVAMQQAKTATTSRTPNPRLAITSAVRLVQREMQQANATNNRTITRSMDELIRQLQNRAAKPKERTPSEASWSTNFGSTASFYTHGSTASSRQSEPSNFADTMAEKKILWL